MLTGLKTIAAASFRLESFVRTISSGMPGLTRAAFMYSVPRSTPRTEEIAEAVARKRHKVRTREDKIEGRRRPWGGIVNAPGKARSDNRVEYQ